VRTDIDVDKRLAGVRELVCWTAAAASADQHRPTDDLVIALTFWNSEPSYPPHRPGIGSMGG